jgi:endoplasmic reticulum protein 29
MRCCIFGVLLAASTWQASATAAGALKLDNYTFDKVVTLPGQTLLVKLDKSYAYGEKEDAFKELCKVAYPVKDFMIAEIPVQEYGDKENDDMRERFGANVDDFPVYYLFKGSADARTMFEGFANPNAKKPANWDDDEDGAWEAPMLGEPTLENLAIWLRMQGVKMPSIGTILELDEAAERFIKQGLKDSEIEAAQKIADEEYKTDAKAPMYIKIMKKIKEKGREYVEKESARVQKVLEGKITPEKRTEMSDKLKILGVFAAVE